jgi:hypothetical protein
MIWKDDDERQILKDMEGGDRDVFEDAIPAGAWEN